MYRVDAYKEVDKNENGVRTTLLRVLEITQDCGFGPDSCHTKSKHITLSLSQVWLYNLTHVNIVSTCRKLRLSRTAPIICEINGSFGDSHPCLLQELL